MRLPTKTCTQARATSTTSSARLEASIEVNASIIYYSKCVERTRSATYDPGFVIGDVFFVIWFGPLHELYPAKLLDETLNESAK
jgi:hypothetical protein